MSVASLRSARLVLRAVCPEDGPALLGLWNEPAVNRFLWDGQPVTAERVAGQIEASRRAPAGGLGLFTLGLVATPEPLVGATGLTVIGDAEPELLVALHPVWWGQGLATEAAHAVLRAAFEALGLPRVWAGADPPNRASLRLIARLGMRFVHERRVGAVPVRYHVLSREDWAARAERGPAR